MSGQTSSETSSGYTFSVGNIIVTFIFVLLTFLSYMSDVHLFISNSLEWSRERNQSRDDGESNWKYRSKVIQITTLLKLLFFLTLTFPDKEAVVFEDSDEETGICLWRQ